MKLIVRSGQRLRGEAAVPGDKSISHRAALFAALAQGESRVDNFLVSGVTGAMLQALTALGVPWALQGATLRVVGTGLTGLHAPSGPLNCGNSATTIRLLTGALAASGVPAILDGSAGLRRRPMGRIVEPLQKMGVPIEAGEGGGAPLLLSARPPETPLRHIAYDLPVASAQVKSCLLLAALAADGPSVLSEPAVSRDHTERMLRGMGVQVDARLSGGVPTVRLVPPRALAPLDLSIPGDFSAAAFLIVAALIAPGSELTLKEIGLNPTRTGLLDALLEMGADIAVSNRHERSGEPVGDLTVRSSALRSVQVSGERVVQMIDEFPAFAVAAAFADGQTDVSEAEELRYKESDRITALCQELQAQGVQVHEKPDGFVVEGCGRVTGGGTVQPYGDHRLAMALAVAGLGAERPITIEDAEIVSESFPAFADVLTGLGADVEKDG